MRRAACASLAVALAISGPVSAQFSDADYPAKALREHKEGTTVISVTVDVTGRAKNCVVTKSSGSDDLDAESCRIFVARGRFTPAKNKAGEPIEGSATGTIRWVLPH